MLDIDSTEPKIITYILQYAPTESSHIKKNCFFVVETVVASIVNFSPHVFLILF